MTTTAQLTIDQARNVCSDIDTAIREARFAERAAIVAHLGYALPDTDETREALADLVNGEHLRTTPEAEIAAADAFFRDQA
jgi:hypothetical protein